MQNITISGNLGGDAELRSVRDTKVLGFNVGVKNGFGKDAGSVWYRCSLWGKAGEVFADSLKKGTKVFITGELTHDEYGGKAQYNVRVGSIDTGPKPSNQTGDYQSNQDSGNGGFDIDDDSDSVPF